jgi:hypothetical protein
MCVFIFDDMLYLGLQGTKVMAETNRTSKPALKKQLGTNPAGQATKPKTPKEIFEQLLGKAGYLPADLSIKKSRVLTER